MLLNICRRSAKDFKCIILVCIIVSLGLSVALFGQIHGGFSVGNKTGTHFYHPRNIFPALDSQRLNNSQSQISTLNLSSQSQQHGPESVNNSDKEATKVLNLDKVYAKVLNLDKVNATVLNSDKANATVLNIKSESDLTMDDSQPCYNVHAFYYPWYGNPEHDGDYYHWNHEFIQHWNKKEAQKWPKGRHVPPDDIGTNFYPLLGPYSSADPAVVSEHMRMMKEADIGVVVVSWYPPGDADTQGKEPDSLMNLILDSANKHNLMVTIHVEPFKDRNQNTMKTQMQYILNKYGSHPAFYRRDFLSKKNLPLIYIYDSYMTSPQDWAKIFSITSPESIRNTDLDAIFIGLWVEAKHGAELVNAGFDGFYTYFATDQFTYGSTWKHWDKLASFAKSQNMLFIPSVGPGYVDTDIRPWNGQNTRDRRNGKYYDESFSSALKHKPDIVSITSFNEWHEGTQIEPAVPKVKAKGKYLDYAPNEPDFYLKKTKHWTNVFCAK